jgi:hypothetical protein
MLGVFRWIGLQRTNSADAVSLITPGHSPLVLMEAASKRLQRPAMAWSSLAGLLLLLAKCSNTIVVGLANPVEYEYHSLQYPHSLPTPTVMPQLLPTMAPTCTTD